jgi:hypothetical protein
MEVNILLGNALKLSIETTTLDFVNSPTRTFYFPQGRWCRILPALTDITDKTGCFESTGGDTGDLTLNTGLEDYYIHLRGGYILPFQDATANNVLKTNDLKQHPTDLIVLQDDAGAANGALFFDDGIHVVTPENSARF